MNPVPYLASEYIEAQAETLSLLVDRPDTGEPSFTAISEITLKLVRARRLILTLDRPLGSTEHGRKILGAFLFDPCAILIDRDLDQNGPRFRFTLAHELGHWALHRTLQLGRTDIDKPLPSLWDSSRHLFFGRKRSVTPRDRLEWQANYFAGALLVPRSAVLRTIIRKQEELGVSRNQGTIYVDRQWQNRLDFKLILEELQKTFQTSRTMMIVRLRQLKLLAYENERLATSGLTHIGSLLKEQGSTGHRRVA